MAAIDVAAIRTDAHNLRIERGLTRTLRPATLTGTGKFASRIMIAATKNDPFCLQAFSRRSPDSSAHHIALLTVRNIWHQMLVRNPIGLPILRCAR
ncbi:MAG: hypothetical protein E5W09_00240 [Mesorhizobium sp.]|nr:MAG: hypothetical protein E5W09_00240 [Mesorhizobium sp.]